MRRQDLEYFKKVHYEPGHMVLVGAGGVDHDSLVRLADTHFKGMKNNISDDLEFNVPSRYTGKIIWII